MKTFKEKYYSNKHSKFGIDGNDKADALAKFSLNQQTSFSIQVTNVTSTLKKSG